MHFINKKMTKAYVAFFLSLFFMTLILTPTILSTIGGDFEISMALDSNEEENKGNEISKTFEVDVYQSNNDHAFFILLNDYHNISFYSSQYTSYDVILHSPPPEFS